MIRIVKNHNTDREKVDWLIDRVMESGGMEYARQKMHELTDKSIELLREFPENEARNALEQLIEYSVDRNK